MADTILTGKKNVDGGVVLFLSTSSDSGLYLYKVSYNHKNILDNIKVIEQTRFSQEKFQRGIIW